MSSRPANFPEVIELGELFSVCLRTRQLCYGGEPLKVERIPLEILILLAERRGEVVTRDEIVDRVWGRNVFLDTDNSIRGAIRKIRHVLGDDAEQPRFIQTITGKGYRLVPPVLEEDPYVSEASSDHNEASQLHDNKAGMGPLVGSGIAHRWFLAMAVVTLVAAAMVAWSKYRHPAHPPGGRLMIAVLPFENLTGDPQQEYFADGFTEEMITQLGELNSQQMGVIARTSVMTLKGSQKPLRDIGRELGVQYVLEGSIRRDPDKVRITAQLVRTDDQTHVWAHEYDRQLQDMLQLQSEIAQEITDEIEMALGSKTPVIASKSSVPKYAAYDSYIKGRFYWNKRTAAGFHQALALFKQSIEQDPNYPRAYAGLADAYALMSSYGLAAPDDYMPKARAAAMKALELDGGLAEAHTALALIAENYDWDWKTAETEFRRAIALNPNYATARQWYAEFLAFQGRFDEALIESDQARQLDPLSLIIAADNGAIYYYEGQYDRAIERFQSILNIDPGIGRAYLIIGAYIEEGRTNDALAEIDKWRQTSRGPWTWDWSAVAYGRAGQLAQAESAVQQIIDGSRRQHLDPTATLAHAYAAMGNKNKALFYLEKAYHSHLNAITVLKVDPVFAPLRSDPRFQDILQRVGLESNRPTR
jgi:TolB-like protein/DNA-binding winged helix-turn-helix (wHTH) protein/Tfp pilus assembly protein PilF